MTLAISASEITDFSVDVGDVYIGNLFEYIIRNYNLDFSYEMKKYTGYLDYLLGSDIIVNYDGNYIRKTDMIGKEVDERELLDLVPLLGEETVERIREIVKASRSTGVIYQVYV